jgi:hypothetical protein
LDGHSCWCEEIAGGFAEVFFTIKSAVSAASGGAELLNGYKMKKLIFIDKHPNNRCFQD